ncbi:MAG: aminoacyl-tRNA hydrolase [Candidatus Brocadiae bacterium]|nr:aminoacyl-tRNA hydrolase [Candidatus Brocadiia bacterium]
MIDDIFVDDSLTIPRSEYEISFAKSGGPGGQNVNKLNTKVYLRWHISESKLDESLFQRIEKSCYSYLTEKGDLLVSSERFRTQEKNIQDCVEKLQKMLKSALVIPKERKKKKITRAEKEKRLQSKKQQSRKKKSRGKITEEH